MTKIIEICMVSGGPHYLEIPNEKLKSWLEYNMPSFGMWEIKPDVLINTTNITDIRTIKEVNPA